MIIRRTAVALPTLLILVIVTFVLMHAAPGGPFTSEKPLPPQVLANIEAKYGLNEPLYKQIFMYLQGIFTEFDFGPSYVYKDRTVNDIIAQGLPVTLTYGAWVIVLMLAVGFSILADLLPNFIMGPTLILIFTLWLGWLPGGGWNGGQWEYMIMPVIALATSYMASITRLTRSSMLEVLRSNFIRTARAKGLPERTIILRHALKPALMPVISYLSPVFVYVITGSFIVDAIFSTGGLGTYFTNAAFNRDYAVMMGVTLLTGGLTILFNLFVDLLYSWIDPQIRY
jgi:oligopeptide transport system permease protein